MGVWLKTGCICCAQNCGLEVQVEDNTIRKVRPDRDNPRSQGYVCRKGLSIRHYQHHKDRLTHPLKRNGGAFERIGWDQALDEIASKLKNIVSEHGPKALAFMGGGGQGCHFEAAIALRLLRSLGSRYHYNALAQELTGMFWVQGRMAGRQYLATIPHDEETDVLVAVGWNPRMSHQTPQARRRIKEISENPDKLLVVVDPRRTETAQAADIHLALKPGTDALLCKALISIILSEGAQNEEYLKAHAVGWEEAVAPIRGFDAAAAARVCGLEMERLRKLARLMTTRKWALHADLGILMNRHSTAVSYLLALLLGLCGRIGVSGGNVFPGYLMPLGSHSDERDPRTWRTVTTDFPAILGTFPPNVVPEEIMSDHPERLRALIVSASNPLRSYADTTAYEDAFKRLDLSVTIEVAMTETAAVSDYVLPARSAYEKWDSTFFAWTYPEIYFQMRRPVVEPEGIPLEESEIHIRLAERLGLLPDFPAELYEAAKGDRQAYANKLMEAAQANPAIFANMPFVVGKTLGSALGSINLALLWGLLQTAPADFRKKAAAAGFQHGPRQSEAIFQGLRDHPEGRIIGVSGSDNLEEVRTPDGKINLHIPELDDWVAGITPESEEAALRINPKYPFILLAGRHFDENANTIMRDPAWNKGRGNYCSLAMHPQDAAENGLTDGQTVTVSTEAGQIDLPLTLDPDTQPGLVAIPHGFGLVFDGVEHGANVNRLTKNTHRDQLAGTPLHRYVQCAVTPTDTNAQ